MREYEVKIAGITHHMQLSDEDASRMGATEKKAASKSTSKRTTKPGTTGDVADD